MSSEKRGLEITTGMELKPILPLLGTGIPIAQNRPAHARGSMSVRSKFSCAIKNYQFCSGKEKFSLRLIC